MLSSSPRSPLWPAICWVDLPMVKQFCQSVINNFDMNYVYRESVLTLGWMGAQHSSRSLDPCTGKYHVHSMNTLTKINNPEIRKHKLAGIFFVPFAEQVRSITHRYGAIHVQIRKLTLILTQRLSVVHVCLLMKWSTRPIRAQPTFPETNVT